jgi:hypothetical protein
MNEYDWQHWKAGCRETGPSGLGSAWQKPAPARMQGTVIRLHQDHPKAFNDVALGMVFIIIAAGGGVAAILGT